MLRVVVSEVGQEALPALDLDGARVVIGSGPAAHVRIPAEAARPEHVRMEAARWVALDAVVIDRTPRAAGEAGTIGQGIVIELGAYRVQVEPAPPGTEASPPQRTESLARELVRSLLGDGAAPSLQILRGVGAGVKRLLPPPDATLVIGRGDEATWVILDADLSRTHAEVRRGWDGVTIRDLESKNGIRVGGAAITRVVPLHDGVTIELGKVVLTFHDPAERHLRGAGATLAATPAAVRAAAELPSPRSAPSPWPFVIATAIAGLAGAGLVWLLVA